MTRLLVVVAGVLIASVAQAQIPVTDPGNLEQAVLIADRTLREYELLQQQYETLTRLSRPLGDLQSYRVPTTPVAAHDPSRWTYGRPWLDALNQGDPTGQRYAAATRTLDRPGYTLGRLPAAARRAVESGYASVDIADALAQAGANRVGLSRAYAAQLERAVSALQGDVVNPDPSFHQLTALLDKVAAGALIGRRQDLAANQLLATAVDQLLARSKRLRDAEAATMNMRLGGMRDGHAASTSIVEGAAQDLRTWRQP